MLHDLDEEMSEEEHQRQEREGGDQQRTGEEHPENPVIVLEMHVEHHDDRELERGKSQKRRHKPAARDDRRYVVRTIPHRP